MARNGNETKVAVGLSGYANVGHIYSVPRGLLGLAARMQTIRRNARAEDEIKEG
jgi:hypothetical protein